MIPIIIADFIYSFVVSNLPGKVIIFILFIGSIGVWSIMIDKFREIRMVERSSEKFLRIYRQGNIFSKSIAVNELSESPLMKIYMTVINELKKRKVMKTKREDLFTTNTNISLEGFEYKDISKISRIAEKVAVAEVLRLEKAMGLLATATTSAPFLGLLGTVWGVMDAFAAMAKYGMVNLPEVAPGIAGALTTTVVGLLVALPSAIGYNFLTEKVRKLRVMIDEFVDEIIDEIEDSSIKNETTQNSE